MLNPSAALQEVTRFVRGEEQTIPCVGGYKYFYLDWNLDIWRCEALRTLLSEHWPRRALLARRSRPAISNLTRVVAPLDARPKA